MTRDQEFDRLAHAYLDGSIFGEDVELLNSLLLGDAEARRLFLELLNLDSALAAAAAAEELPAESNEEVSGTDPAAKERKENGGRSRFRPLASWLAAAASLALVAAGLWWQSTRKPFATVVRVAGAETLQLDDELSGKLQVIERGTVELATARGVRVVIEAPAEFRFESGQRLHMIHGRLAAEVPSAGKGFTVVTPSGKAVDLGTRFGVDVPRRGEAEIHVFEGEVIAKASGSTETQSLGAGDAVTMREGTSTAREMRSAAFIGPAEVGRLTAGLAAGQRHRADVALAALRDDPALIALFDFESTDRHEGAYRFVQGRWPGSQAAEFTKAGDHLKIDVGGDRAWRQLTLAVWVRLDRVGGHYQSLLHTDGWDQGRLGQLHWMISPEQRMRFALFGNTLLPGSEELEVYPDSRTPVLPEWGSWIHLATVYDADARTVRFYLNGRLDKESRQAIAHPVQLGRAQIGNWDEQNRELSGRVDELVILGRAMSKGEVRALFEAGNPYP